MAITFDGPNKLMTLTAGTTSVSVRELWSRWVDWFLTDDNSKYLPAFTSLGGDEIDQSAGTFVPIYAFLMNGWKIKPQEANHTLAIGDGILVVNGGGDPFVETIGAYTVRINYQQPVQAITVSTSGSSVDVDEIVEGVWNALALSYQSPDSMGEKLNDAGSGSNPWNEVIENGYTAAQILRILAAMAAGKTTITEGVSTVVEFKGIDGTTSRIEAEMEGSERINIVLDGD